MYFLTVPNILGLIAAIYIVLSIINYVRKGKFSSQERTWLTVATIFIIVIVYLHYVNPGMMGKEKLLTYKNTFYGYTFQYPENSLIYSDVAVDGKNVVPPNDNEVCVSEGKEIPGVGPNDDPEVFCVEGFKNTKLSDYLKNNRGITLSNVQAGKDPDKSIKNGDVVDRSRGEILHQAGPNLLRFYGSRLVYPVGLEGVYSRRVYGTFKAI